ncbi:hypothetical protein BJY24_001181 [Nocardia transvalensis]|uniref:Membrane protein (TIGR02234 family) n=1 Tax=Nocardia transvalensis TaxID=37333 RepID=A0A7W9PAV5_9NOCA|nr:hypothetical protein [Nocardia transvalensis]MBB5912314.1 hypothetical protein [Nocardia transvalensis]
MNWGFLCSAALSLTTFSLLFHPWLTAEGPKGRVTSDAFGRMEGVTSSFNDPRAAEGFEPLHINGSWGVLTAALAVTTVFAALIYLCDRGASLAKFVMGSSAALALSVFCTLLYLNAKAPEFKTLAEESSSGSGLRNLFSGNKPAAHEVASAGLGFAALLGGVTALGAVLIAVAAALPKRVVEQSDAEQPAVLAQQAVPEPAPQAAEPVLTAPARTTARTRKPRITAQPRTATARATARRHPDVEGLRIQLPYRPIAEGSKAEYMSLVGSASQR